MEAERAPDVDDVVEGVTAAAAGRGGAASDEEASPDGGARTDVEAGARADAELLLGGEITVLGQLRDSSNETFLVELAGVGEEPAWAIYKPELGEAPLRDFPPGLYRRERAAYLLSESLGWHLVPTTVIREDGPFGVGSLQRFVEHDRAAHYFTLVDDAATHDDLRRIAVFDAVTNNTDRKSGHVLQGTDGRIWGIDHGLCFSAAPKLRTVVWDFSGEQVPDDLVSDLREILHAVPEGVADLLTEREVVALRARTMRLVLSGRLPEDLTGMAFPWPLV
ncbi:MAG: SCO1664 family protein [Actinomycetaceae bacterium]